MNICEQDRRRKEIKRKNNIDLIFKIRTLVEQLTLESVILDLFEFSVGSPKLNGEYNKYSMNNMRELYESLKH